MNRQHDSTIKLFVNVVTSTSYILFLLSHSLHVHVSFAFRATPVASPTTRCLPLSIQLRTLPLPGHQLGQEFSLNSVRRGRPSRVCLASSFFGKFDEEELDDDDDDEDDDEYADVDDMAVANFRSKMSSLFGGESQSESNDEENSSTSSDVDELIRFATQDSSNQEEEVTEWARPVDSVDNGVVLLANPSKFCKDFGGSRSSPSPALLSKFGLTLPPPASLGPDRRADLLPVLMVVERQISQWSTQAVLLNRRTGYLLGDLEAPPEQGGGSGTPLLEKFCIQPLWFGGVNEGGSIGSGLDMLHRCPAVKDTTELPAADSGLYWGGDPAQAQEAMSDPSLDRLFTGFDFKFFVQSTLWAPRALEKEIEDGVWFCASVSNEVLFKSRDRMGTQRAKPLWTEIMELMGGEYNEVRNQLYGEDN